MEFKSLRPKTVPRGAPMNAIQYGHSEGDANSHLWDRRLDHFNGPHVAGLSIFAAWLAGLEMISPNAVRVDTPPKSNTAGQFYLA